MEFSNPILDAEVTRQLLDERRTRAAVPKIPSTARRHLLARGLRRFADLVDN